MFLFSSNTIEISARVPDSSDFRRPLPEIQGENRKAGVNMTTRYALYTCSGSCNDLASSSR
jgi:hypothetical protein